MRSTQPLLKKLTRLALTTKQTNKGYYKGTGTGSTGRHTKYGGFVIEWEKVRTYVVPAKGTESKLSPFVTAKIEPVRGNFKGDPKGAFSGEAYLARWKTENGED